MAIPLPCFHCGLPVPAGSPYQTRVLDEDRAMCCPGCQAVAEAIVAGGLESYYRHRSETAANPEALPKALTEELALYDRPDVQEGLVEHQGQQAQTCLLIEGISCAACAWLIEKKLAGESGVLQATVNLSTHRLHVEWDDGATGLGQLLASLAGIGYRAHPYRSDAHAEQMRRGQRHHRDLVEHDHLPRIPDFDRKESALQLAHAGARLLRCGLRRCWRRGHLTNCRTTVTSCSAVKGLPRYSSAP